MKKLQHFLAYLLVLCVLCALVPFAYAQTGAVRANAATRHVLCTDLSAQAQAYYANEYTYEALSELHGVYAPTDSYAATQNNPLYTALSALMTDTHTNRNVAYSGYGSNALATYWQKTDTEDGANTYLYFYTDILADDSSVSGLQLNREHVWPKSRASFYQKGGGADLHHLRPSVSFVNLAKSNYAFGTLVGTDTDYSTTQVNGADVIWTKKSADLLEVRDNIKGDVARILLYVYVRWQQPNLYTAVAADKLPPMDSDDSQSDGKRVVESLETLLRWCELDPVDEWEMARNDQIENVQGNRNVFIDYPEFAWLMFGCEVPEMNTPSGMAKHTGDESYTITWNVNGKLTEQSYHAGEQPVFTGSTDKPDDAGYRYTFTGWEPAVVPAAADVTYTAQYAGVPIAAPKTDYTDVKESDWYADAVDYVTAHSLMNGVGEKRFAPQANVTRAMLVTILYRAEDEPGVATIKNPFTDVAAGKWYTDAIIWAADEGIVNGTGATTFDPETAITREQIAAILYRYEGTYGGTGDLSGFPDGGSVSSYAMTAMRWAVGEGLIGGMSGTLSPRATASRAQLATILMRYFN